MSEVPLYHPLKHTHAHTHNKIVTRSLSLFLCRSLSLSLSRSFFLAKSLSISRLERKSDRDGTVPHQRLFYHGGLGGQPPSLEPHSDECHVVLRSSSKEGSYLRRVEFCITQL